MNSERDLDRSIPKRRSQTWAINYARSHTLDIRSQATLLRRKGGKRLGLKLKAQPDGITITDMKERCELSTKLLGTIITEIALGDGIICWDVDAAGRCTTNGKQKKDAESRRLRLKFGRFVMLHCRGRPKNGDRSWDYKELLAKVKGSGSGYSITARRSKVWI